MRIALPEYSGYIYQQFGRSDEFRFVDIAEEDQMIRSSQTVSCEGRRRAQLADWLLEEGVDAVICGGIEPELQKLLTARGIVYYGGVAGDCDKAIAALMTGGLHYNVSNEASLRRQSGMEPGSGSAAGDDGADTDAPGEEPGQPASGRHRAEAGTGEDAETAEFDEGQPISGYEAYHDKDGKLHMPLLF